MNHPPLIIRHEPASPESDEKLALLAGVEDVTGHFDLVNLTSKKYVVTEARKNATRIKNKLEAEIDEAFVFLMGRKVERAFGWKNLNYLDTNIWLGHYVILLPPIGAFRWWNDPENYAAGRAMLRWALRVSA